MLLGLPCQLDIVTVYMGVILQMAKSELHMKHIVIKLSNGVFVHYRYINSQRTPPQARTQAISDSLEPNPPLPTLICPKLDYRAILLSSHQ